MINSHLKKTKTLIDENILLERKQNILRNKLIRNLGQIDDEIRKEYQNNTIEVIICKKITKK